MNRNREASLVDRIDDLRVTLEHIRDRCNEWLEKDEQNPQLRWIAKKAHHAAINLEGHRDE